MEPRFQATQKGSMVPWFHPKFFGWNHGTMEPRFQATQKRFHGSMVPGWNHGTMEPWNPNVYYVYSQEETDLIGEKSTVF